MKRLLPLLALIALPSPLQAGASQFVLVNGTETALAEMVIRRAGTDSWKPLGASAAPGSSQPVKFADPDCAFDIRANVAGSGPVTWAGVNLCDVKSVTLKSDSAAGPWVDYDAR